MAGSEEDYTQQEPPPDDTTARVLPHCIDAERSVLGACLHPVHCDEGVVAATAALRPEHFYLPQHKRIFAAVAALHTRGESTDLIAVAAELESTGHLADCGGRAGLADLADTVFTAATTPDHARIVLDRAIKRDILRVGHDLIGQCRDSFGDAAAILAQARTDLESAGGSLPQSSICSVADAAHATLALFDSYKTGHTDLIIPTPFTRLNDMMGGGLREGHYTIIAARPSVGKTSLAHNIAAFVAAQNIPIGIFSLEMSSVEIVERMACSMAHVDSSLLRLNRLNQDEFVSVSEAVGILAGMPIYIDDSPTLTDAQLRSRCKTMADKYGVKMIVVDYLQLLTSSAKSENRQQEVTAISRTCMAIPKETKTTLVALSQLSRDSDKVTRRPKLSDLRDSGSLEQDANNVCFLHRDDAAPGVVELLLLKQRNGPTGTIKTTWLKEFTKFENYADEVGY